VQIEITFWQAFSAIASLFILWSVTLATVMSWLNNKFGALLKRTDYDIRHEVLRARVEAIYDQMVLRTEENRKIMERRFRNIELWAASRGVNGPESYRFVRGEDRDY